MTATVLLVDDDRQVLHGLRLGLSGESCAVLTSSSATEALALMGRHDVDVVVSDECMPGMGGSELLAAIGERYPDTMRIVLSGQSTFEAALRAINDGGVFRYLTKPCPISELATAIRQALLVRGLAAKSRQLLQVSRRQSETLRAIEREHPGLTRINRGVDESVGVTGHGASHESLVSEIEAELAKCEL
jgi:two-component system probable response regulator PhcQ